MKFIVDQVTKKCKLVPSLNQRDSLRIIIYLEHACLKACCHPRISYGHTKFISQVHSKNIGISVEVSFHLNGF